jgi:hypothetical protein
VKGGGDESNLYEVLWAIGQIGGAYAVLEVMGQFHSDERILKRCLAVFAKQLWRPEDIDVAQLPQVLEKLVKITEHFLQTSGTSSRPFDHESQKHCVEALGGVLNSLAQHVQPGSLLAADQGVQLLMQAVGPDYNELVARSAAASLGHMVSGAPAWRKPLTGFVSVLGQRISNLKVAEEENVQHQRCFCWVATIIGGFSVVVEAMTAQQHSPTVQQAAIASLIDILEDHSECASLNTLLRSDVDIGYIPKTIEVITLAMKQHRAYAPVQYHGLHALGLLHNNLPPSQDVHPGIIEGVLGSLKSHPTSYKVASGVCSALRLFLYPRVGADREASDAATRRAIEALRHQQCKETLQKLLQDFSFATDRELFSDVAFVLSLVDTPLAVISELGKSKPESLVLRGGLMKGLFELARAFNDILQPEMSQGALAAVERIAAEASAKAANAPTNVSAEEANEVVRASELLGGLLAANVAVKCC